MSRWERLSSASGQTQASTRPSGAMWRSQPWAPPAFRVPAANEAGKSLAISCMIGHRNTASALR